MLVAMYFVMKWMSELKLLKNKVAIILAGELDLNLNEYITSDMFVIAVDGGYNHLLAADIKPNLVIGDMDSITQEVSVDTIKFDTVKDDTDFKCAINYVNDNITDCHIFIFGFGSLNRLDHVIANLSVIEENMTFISANQKITTANSSIELTSSEYKYISFFALSSINKFNLVGFKYPLDNYKLNPFDPLCVSNELEGNSGEIDISNGQLLIIESKES